MGNATEESPGAEVRMVGEADLEPTYANFAKISVSPLDAVITFARVDPMTASAEEGGEIGRIDAVAVARVFLPRETLDRLYDVMATQLDGAQEATDETVEE